MATKKFYLGSLEAKDNGKMERDEIIIEIVDRMQKYVAEVERAAKNTTLTRKERYDCVKHTIGRFCGLADFLNNELNIEIRNPASGMLYTQEMFNRAYYHETMLKVEIAKAEEAEKHEGA